MSEIHSKITYSPVHPEGCHLRERLSCKLLIDNNLIEDYINVIFNVIFVAKLPEDYIIGNLRRTLINTRFLAIETPKITSGGVCRAYCIFRKPEIDRKSDLPLLQPHHLSVSPENKISNTLSLHGLKSGKRFQFTSDDVEAGLADYK